MAFSPEEKTCSCGKKFNGNYYNHFEKCSECVRNSEEIEFKKFLSQFNKLSRTDELMKIKRMLFDLTRKI